MPNVDIIQLLKQDGGEKFYPVTHVDAVIGLKDASYFDLVPDTQDPTKFSVKLKPEYTGLWAEGWVASGGVGSQSGGGGGGASYLDDLLDVTAPNPATDDLLRWNGSAWVNVPQSQFAPAISFSDLTSHPNSLSGYGINDAYTKTQVDTLLSNIDLDDYGASLSLGSVATYLKDANGKFVVDSSGRYIITAGTSTSINLVNGSGTVISSVTLPSTGASELLSLYVPTSRTINGHSLATDITLSAVSDLGVAQWAMGGEGDKIPFSILPDLYTIGTKVTDTAAKGTMLGIEAISNDLSSTGSENSLIKWENGAWHVFGNLYADGWIAAGGIGNGSGGGGGTNSLYELVEVLPSTNPSTNHVFYYNGSKWTNTPLKTINGNNLIGSGNIQIEGGGGGGSTVAISNLLTSGKRVATVTIDGTDYTIKDGLVWGTYNDSAKTVALTLNGQQYVLCVNGYSAGGGVSSESDPIFTASAAYGITSQNIASWNAKSNFSGSFNDLSNKPTTISGYGISDAKIANGVITLGNSTITPLTSHQSIYALTLSAGAFTAGTYTPNSASKSFNIPTTLDHITDGTNRKLSDYVTLSGMQTITGAKTFTTNPVTIGSDSGLSVNASSYIDIGNARLVYDSGANALHITKKSGSATVGLFADGFVAAGGVAGQTTISYVDLESNQTIDGDKSFDGTTTFNGMLNVDCPSIFSTEAQFSDGISLSGTLNGLSVTKDSNNYVSLRASRIDIQDNGSNLFLCRGSGKVFLCNHPGGTVSHKLYLDSSSTAIAQSWNTHSDFRLKEDIVELQKDDSIEKLMALKPSVWKWKSGLAKGQTASGFIAQEVEPIIPFMVTGDDYKGLAYQMLHAYEVSAIQSHEERIKILEKKMEKIEG